MKELGLEEKKLITSLAKGQQQRLLHDHAHRLKIG